MEGTLLSCTDFVQKLLVEKDITKNACCFGITHQRFCLTLGQTGRLTVQVEELIVIDVVTHVM